MDLSYFLKKKFISLSIFSPENKSLYEVKPVPNKSPPLTHLATHAKKINTKILEKSTQICPKKSISHSNETECQNNLCSKIESCNNHSWWDLVCASTYLWYICTPNLIKIGSETKMLFPVFHIYCEIDHGHISTKTSKPGPIALVILRYRALKFLVHFSSVLPTKVPQKQSKVVTNKG